MVLTPTQFFLQWLGRRPLDARMAIAVDSDRLIADAGLLGKPTLPDTTGRAWQVVVYCGDEIWRSGSASARSLQPLTSLSYSRAGLICLGR